MKFWVLSATFSTIILALAACGGQELARPAPTAEPATTSTAIAAATVGPPVAAETATVRSPLPTATPLPAATPAPTPTTTPFPPTLTPVPSPTAVPRATVIPTPLLTPTPAINAAQPAPPAKVRAWATVTGRVILVTNTTDEVNGDTSSIDALLAAPGADGISLREALITANATEGAKTITFASALKGGTIKLRAVNFPVLTSGMLTINGDIDGDKKPDITLDGSQAKHGLAIRSSGNTIAYLHLVNFTGTTIRFSCTTAACEPRVVRNTRIVGNVIETTGRNAIEINPQGLGPESTLYYDLAWEDIEIIGNTITAGPNTAHINLRPGANGGSRNRISRITISNNIFTGGTVGINLHAGDETSIERGAPPPIRYSDDNLIEDATISDNVLTGVRFQGIILQAANMGNRGNRIVRTLISGNKITATERPIYITPAAGTNNFGSDQPRSTSRNIVSDVEVRGNLIEPDPYRAGIELSGGGKPAPLRPVPVTENRIERVAILDNEILISQPGVVAIRVQGGVVHGPERVARNAVTDVTISENRISGDHVFGATGIEIIGGRIAFGDGGTAQQNEVRNIVIRENSMSGVSTAIALLGGRKAGSTGNAIVGYFIEANEVGGAPVRIIADDEGASDNSVR